MLMVVGNISSDGKENLIRIGEALAKEGYVVAYNSGYYSAIVMENAVEKKSEEESE